MLNITAVSNVTGKEVITYGVNTANREEAWESAKRFAAEMNCTINLWEDQTGEVLDTFA